MPAALAARTHRLPSHHAAQTGPLAPDDPFSAALRCYVEHGQLDEFHLRRLRESCADETEAELAHIVRVLGEALRGS